MNLNRKKSGKFGTPWIDISEDEVNAAAEASKENEERWKKNQISFQEEFLNEMKTLDQTLVDRLIGLCENEKYKNQTHIKMFDLPVRNILKDYRNGNDNLFFYILTRPEISNSDKMKFMNFILVKENFLRLENDNLVKTYNNLLVKSRDYKEFFKQDNYDNVLKFLDEDGNNILASVLCDEDVDSSTKLQFCEIISELNLDDLFTFENTKDGSKFKGYNVGVCTLSSKEPKLYKFLEDKILKIKDISEALEFRRKSINQLKIKSKQEQLSSLNTNEKPLGDLTKKDKTLIGDLFLKPRHSETVQRLSQPKIKPSATVKPSDPDRFSFPTFPNLFGTKKVYPSSGGKRQKTKRKKTTRRRARRQ